MEVAAERQLDLVTGIEPDVLEKGYDVWIDEVEALVDNDVIPEVEERVAEVASLWSPKIGFECDHTSVEWTATFPGHPQGEHASGGASLPGYDSTRSLYDELLAEQRAEAAKD